MMTVGRTFPLTTRHKASLKNIGGGFGLIGLAHGIWRGFGGPKIPMQTKHGLLSIDYGVLAMFGREMRHELHNGRQIDARVEDTRKFDVDFHHQFLTIQ